MSKKSPQVPVPAPSATPAPTSAFSFGPVPDSTPAGTGMGVDFGAGSGWGKCPAHRHVGGGGGWTEPVLVTGEKGGKYTKPDKAKKSKKIVHVVYSTDTNEGNVTIPPNTHVTYTFSTGDQFATITMLPFSSVKYDHIDEVPFDAPTGGFTFGNNKK